MPCAKFLGRKAIFPGRDYLQQLRLIIETLGPPSKEDLSIIQNPQAVEYIKRLPNRSAVAWKTPDVQKCMSPASSAPLQSSTARAMAIGSRNGGSLLISLAGPYEMRNDAW